MTAKPERADDLIAQWSALQVEAVRLERDIDGRILPAFRDRRLLRRVRRGLADLEHRITVAVAQELTPEDDGVDWDKLAREWARG